MPESGPGREQDARGTGIAQAQGERAKAIVKTIIKAAKRPGIYIQSPGGWSISIVICSVLFLISVMLSPDARKLVQSTASTAAALALAPTSTSTPTATPMLTQPTPPRELLHPRIVGPEIDDLEVTITSPEHCASDLKPGWDNQIRGTYDGNKEGRRIWVLAYASDSDRFFPKGVSQSAGSWNTVLWDVTGAWIDIVVTVAVEGSLADNTLEDWLEQCKSNEGCPPGLSHSELPDGLTEMDAITVKTTR